MRDLTKWPRLTVVGEPVTEDQADEILIRTNNWDWIGCNDKAWKQMVETCAGVFGFPPEPSWAEEFETRVDRMRDHSYKLGEFKERMGILELSYLDNCRIESSWIGGPKGWCDWDGTIGTRNYNIGKWPSHEEVLADWEKIAQAFPYLRLNAQLWPDEGEGGSLPAVQYNVRDGQVTWWENPLDWIEPNDEGTNLFSVFLPGGERGVGVQRLMRALQTTRKRATGVD